jgi:hypothetical protein
LASKKCGEKECKEQELSLDEERGRRHVRKLSDLQLQRIYEQLEGQEEA